MLTAAALLFAATVSSAGTPTLAEIAAYEAAFGSEILLPSGMKPLSAYVRRYQRTPDGYLYGQFVLSGTFGETAPPGAIVIAAGQWSGIADGGCAVINVYLYAPHDPRNVVKCGGR